MSNLKKRNEISEDELMYREMLQKNWHVTPSRRAVRIFQERLEEVLKRLGVDVNKDAESIQTQMEIMDIFVNSLSEEAAPKAAGLYVSARIKGELAPYAYISAAKVKHHEYMFPIVYWGEEGGRGERMDEGKGEKL